MVESGTLINNAKLENLTLTVQRGTTLAGSPTLGGVTVADGGIIAPGPSLGTLTVTGDLFLSPGAQLHYDIGAPGTATSPGASDLIEVGGHLTLDGELRLADAGRRGSPHRLMTTPETTRWR